MTKMKNKREIGLKRWKIKTKENEKKEQRKVK